MNAGQHTPPAEAIGRAAEAIHVIRMEQGASPGPLCSCHDVRMAIAALDAAAPWIAAQAAAAERELLADAERALTACWKAALTVKPTLNVPYPDAPETTPWLMFAGPSARHAHDLAMKIRKHLRGAS